MTDVNPIADPARRLLLQLLAAAPLLPALARPAAASDPGAPFSFDALSEEMRAAAARPWAQPAPPPGWWGELDYDGYRMIRFRDDRARWGDGTADWRLQAFHMGWLFPEPVRLYDVTDGTAQEIAFSTDDFDYFGDLAAKVPAHGGLPGVAGFRLNWPLNTPDRFDEVVSFVGASYFRALGRGDVYGASARGVAVNTWVAAPEEFPSFTRFYLSREPEAATVHAALEGPSLTGAYRFTVRPGEPTEIDVTARLFFRTAVEEMGVGPLTSMFLFAGQNRGAFDDYRPNVHDSDGLGIVRADGQPVWRPLNNPAQLANSYFAGPTPQSFGLYQRERRFEDFQDPGARYDLRPSVEVRPKGDWGPGSVRLVEIPSDLEANDNIVAFWVPDARPGAGESREYDYILRWGRLAPDPAAPLAHVARTRAGAGGVSGVEAIEDARKFVVDFRGGPLADLPADLPEALRPLPVATLSTGHLLSTTLDRLPDGAWRVVLDASAPRGAIVELSVQLSGSGERSLSETWAYQWVNA